MAVYVPKQYIVRTAAPFIVGADGPDRALFTALDNLIAQHRVPLMIAISISTPVAAPRAANAAWNTTPCQAGTRSSWRKKLPLVEKQYNVKLTKDPEGIWAPSARAAVVTNTSD